MKNVFIGFSQDILLLACQASAASVAEGGGFEPRYRFQYIGFETDAFNHSATLHFMLQCKRLHWAYAKYRWSSHLLAKCVPERDPSDFDEPSWRVGRFELPTFSSAARGYPLTYERITILDDSYRRATESCCPLSYEGLINCNALSLLRRRLL